MSSASPNMLRQYSAIFACCLALGRGGILGCWGGPPNPQAPPPQFWGEKGGWGVIPSPSAFPLLASSWFWGGDQGCFGGNPCKEGGPEGSGGTPGILGDPTGFLGTLGGSPQILPMGFGVQRNDGRPWRFGEDPAGLGGPWRFCGDPKKFGGTLRHLVGPLEVWGGTLEIQGGLTNLHGSRRRG